MNIVMQICGLLVVSFLFILYRSHKTLHLPSEKVFMTFLVIVFVCLSLDAASVVAIHFRNVLPEWLWKLCCRGYLVSMMWVGWINFSYVSIDLNSTAQKHRRAMQIMALVSIAGSALAGMLPIDVFEEGRSVYTLGPAVVATYVVTLLFIVSTLNIAIFISRHGSRRRGFAVIITTLVWIAAAVIQALHNELLLVGFSEALGAMILYIVMENPDANLDKRFGCFNPYAFHEYISARFADPKDFSIMEISLTDVKSLEERGINVESEAKKVITKLNSYKGSMLFKNDFANLVVISEDDELLNRIASDFIEMVAAYSAGGNEMIVFTVRGAKQFRDSAELLNFLTYVRESSAARLSTIVLVSDEMIENYRNIGNMRKEIDTALAEDRVEVFLQPIYDCIAKSIVSAEALVRIRKPEGGYLSPGAFIPVAERTGQIRMLGERVLEKVCAFIKENDLAALGMNFIDVNLSAIQCDDNMLAGKICKIVDSYGVDHSLISFEITETAVSSAKDTLLDNMNALVSKGFRFALDDFGKGESNLFYIVELPVEFIKLDMDMIKAYFANPKAKPVVGAISRMGQQLGLPIVSEGVETRSEAEGIAAEGITLIQGYYYSRPLPTDEFLAFLSNFRETHGKNEETAAVSADTENTGEVFDISALAGQKVLLVEDNELNRELAKELLEEFDFLVDTAEDGTVAVDMMSSATPGDYDFILMDIKMPYMDGFEATRRIRSLENKIVADIPVLALTAYSDDESKALARATGINGIASKPIDVRKIMEMIAQIEAGKKSLFV